MANNRMFLVHRPTGLRVYLGKRFGWGWKNVPNDLGEQLQKLFDYLRENPHGSQDDFLLAMEDVKEAPGAFDLIEMKPYSKEDSK